MNIVMRYNELPILDYLGHIALRTDPGGSADEADDDAIDNSPAGASSTAQPSNSAQPSTSTAQPSTSTDQPSNSTATEYDSDSDTSDDSDLV